MDRQAREVFAELLLGMCIEFPLWLCGPHDQSILIPDAVAAVIERMPIERAESITERASVYIWIQGEAQSPEHSQVNTVQRIPEQANVKGEIGRQLQISGNRFASILDVDFIGWVDQQITGEQVNKVNAGVVLSKKIDRTSGTGSHVQHDEPVTVRESFEEHR